MLGKGNEKLCQWEGSYMPSSCVSVFVRGGGGGGEGSAIEI